MELLLLTFLLLNLVSTGARGVAIKIRVDSVFILSWPHTCKFNSQLALSASLLFVAIYRRFEFSIREAECFTFEENWIYDARSRGVNPSQMMGLVPTLRSQICFYNEDRLFDGHNDIALDKKKCCTAFMHVVVISYVM